MIWEVQGWVMSEWYCYFDLLNLKPMYIVHCSQKNDSELKRSRFRFRILVFYNAYKICLWLHLFHEKQEYSTWQNILDGAGFDFFSVFLNYSKNCRVIQKNSLEVPSRHNFLSITFLGSWWSEYSFWSKSCIQTWNNLNK